MATIRNSVDLFLGPQRNRSTETSEKYSQCMNGAVHLSITPLKINPTQYDHLISTTVLSWFLSIQADVVDVTWDTEDGNVMVTMS